MSASATVTYERVTYGSPYEARPAALAPAPDPDQAGLTRVDQRVGDGSGNTFWCDDDGLLRTDWRGATSWRTTWADLAPQLDTDVLDMIGASGICAFNG